MKGEARAAALTLLATAPGARDTAASRHTVPANQRKDRHRLFLSFKPASPSSLTNQSSPLVKRGSFSLGEVGEGLCQCGGSSGRSRFERTAAPGERRHGEAGEGRGSRQGAGSPRESGSRQESGSPGSPQPGAGRAGPRPPGELLALVPPQACATPAGDFDSSDEEAAEEDPGPLPISW